MSKPETIPCSVFGGRSPKTGKPVGARHSWLGGYRCRFCGSSREDVLKRTDPWKGSPAPQGDKHG